MSEYSLPDAPASESGQSEGRIEGYKAHIKALEEEIDKICKMWDDDRKLLRGMTNES